MIFVTVGTHEQPFNRLIEAVDKLKGDGMIEEDVVIQKGYSTYQPINCESYDLIGYDEMDNYIHQARIVITHGGPASFIAPLALKKIPIVVPRQKQFNEHVNDHQLEFCRAIEERQRNLIVVENIEELSITIQNYSKIVCSIGVSMVSNTSVFNKRLMESIQKLF